MRISKKKLAELKNMPDSEIDYSDIPELDDWFWSNAQLIEPKSTPITIRVDTDVLGWFKSNSKQYQTLINSVLRSYVVHKTKIDKKP